MKNSIAKAAAQHRPWDILRFVAHVPSFARLFFGLLADPRVGLWAKTLFVGAVVYAVTPLDFLPDYLPFLGGMDDLGILAMGCRWFLSLCPAEVVDEHVARIDQSGQWNPFGRS